MLLQPQYTYQPLPRANINGERRYSTPDGSKLPSVTTILDATKPEEAKQALREWKNRVGHQKAQQITTEAANRGTRMHTYLEHYVLTGEMKERPTNPFAVASHDMALEVINKGFTKIDRVWGVEVPLYFPDVYAGTTDSCGIHGGAEAIMDYKQSNKVKKTEWISDYFIQLAAYANAHNELHGTKIRKGVILMCVKPEEITPGNYSTPPQYLEWVIEGNEFDKWNDAWWRRVEEYYQKFV